LLKGDLFRVINAIGSAPKDIRDRALLLIGFAGAFRRSELVTLDREDISFTPKGLVISVRRSKTDPFGAGRRIGISVSSDGHCAVTALERWLSLSRIDCGPIFRRIDRHGRILSYRISSEAVALILKGRLSAAGIGADAYSGHSLRAGYVTSAALAGVPTWKIRQQTGHASDLMLNRYIRNANIFQECSPVPVL
jgi:integrase